MGVAVAYRTYVAEQAAIGRFPPQRLKSRPFLSLEKADCRRSGSFQGSGFLTAETGCWLETREGRECVARKIHVLHRPATQFEFRDVATPQERREQISVPVDANLRAAIERELARRETEAKAAKPKRSR